MSDEETFSTPTERAKGSKLEYHVPQRKNKHVDSTLEVWKIHNRRQLRKDDGSGRHHRQRDEQPSTLQSKISSHSSEKGEAPSTEAYTVQVKEPEVASNHRQVSQGSIRPMEAQCRELWGHPI